MVVVAAVSLVVVETLPPVLAVSVLDVADSVPESAALPEALVSPEVDAVVEESVPESVVLPEALVSPAPEADADVSVPDGEALPEAEVSPEAEVFASLEDVAPAAASDEDVALGMVEDVLSGVDASCDCVTAPCEFAVPSFELSCAMAGAMASMAAATAALM